MCFHGVSGLLQGANPLLDLTEGDGAICFIHRLLQFLQIGPKSVNLPVNLALELSLQRTSEVTIRTHGFTSLEECGAITPSIVEDGSLENTNSKIPSMLILYVDVNFIISVCSAGKQATSPEIQI
jgi:hypothetical protein